MPRGTEERQGFFPPLGRVFFFLHDLSVHSRTPVRCSSASPQLRDGTLFRTPRLRACRPSICAAQLRWALTVPGRWRGGRRRTRRAHVSCRGGRGGRYAALGGGGVAAAAATPHGGRRRTRRAHVSCRGGRGGRYAALGGSGVAAAAAAAATPHSAAAASPRRRAPCRPWQAEVAALAGEGGGGGNGQGFHREGRQPAVRQLRRRGEDGRGGGGGGAIGAVGEEQRRGGRCRTAPFVKWLAALSLLCSVCVGRLATPCLQLASPWRGAFLIGQRLFLIII